VTRLAGLLLVPPTLLAVTGGALVAALRPPALAVSERRDWVFRNVTLVEAGRPPRPGRTLQIRSGRIAPSPLPRAAEAPDLAGLYVAPGLIDMHVHYPPKLAVGNIELWSLLLLSHGVTSVRETGSIDGSIFEVRAAIRRGARPGPRIFACGEILDGPDPSFPSNRVVRTASEAREAVRDLAARGADCV
jgi:imidazolonepropionase-like amidohydrolase